MTPTDEILRRVVMDYADSCCDALDTCDCAMAQAARLVRDRQLPGAIRPHEVDE